MTPHAERIFDTSLYAVSAIDEAIEAFANLATFTSTADDHTVHITLTPRENSPHDAETLASEFANFALAQTIHRSR